MGKSSCMEDLGWINKVAMGDTDPEMQNLKDNWLMDTHHESNDVLIVWLCTRLKQSLLYSLWSLPLLCFLRWKPTLLSSFPISLLTLTFNFACNYCLFDKWFVGVKVVFPPSNPHFESDIGGMGFKTISNWGILKYLPFNFFFPSTLYNGMKRIFYLGINVNRNKHLLWFTLFYFLHWKLLI